MELFQQPLRPINLGLESFYDSMASQGAEPVAVDWRPPLDGYAELSHTRAGVDVTRPTPRRCGASCGPAHAGRHGDRPRRNPWLHPFRKARMLITHSGPPITWGACAGRHAARSWAR